MITRRVLPGLLTAFVVLIFITTMVAAQDTKGTSLGTGFTYQGHLKNNNAPYTGLCDLQFGLYDALTAGTQLGLVGFKNVPVSDGYFTVVLDYGVGLFTGESRWLEIEVRCPAAVDTYTLLTPRQPLTAAPYALALPGLWTVPNSTSPNVFGGFSGNFTTPGIVGTTIGGGGNLSDPNLISDNYNTVSGGLGNTAGNFNEIPTDAYYATVGGGIHNEACNAYATIAGGFGNTACGNSSFVGGGAANGSMGLSSTVSGGYVNESSGDYSAIGGGMSNLSSGAYSTVGGGGGNQSTGYDSTIGGGSNNSSFDWATVAGGRSNQSSGAYSTIGGGYDNTSSFDYATVAGGYLNQSTGNASSVGGGSTNTSSSDSSTVSGGYNNTASAIGSTVPGGLNNVASGITSFAAGRRAKATSQGCFVWGDSADADITCSNTNRWIARAGGGVYFYTKSDLSTGMYLASAGSAWNAVSARDLKENFTLVDTNLLLENIAKYPITSWNYKAQDASIRHIGLMADEFNALLDGLGGEGMDHINSLDADGVALAAIQGLYAQNQELIQQTDDQAKQIDDLETRIEQLEKMTISNHSLQSSMGIPLPWLILVGILFLGGNLLKNRMPGHRQ